MKPGLIFRISLVCLQLFGSGSCLPVTKNDYVYPYASYLWPASGNLPSPGNEPVLSSQGFHPPLASQPQEAVAEGQLPRKPTSEIQASASYRSKGFRVSPEVPKGSPQSIGISPNLPQQPITPDNTPDSSFVAEDVESSNLGLNGTSSGSKYAASHNAAAPDDTTDGFEYPAHTNGLTYESSAPEDLGSPLNSAFRGPWDELPPVGAYASPGFPDDAELNAESAEVMYVSEPLPLLPLLYITQSRNGYQRSRAVFSNSRYLPKLLQHPVFGSGTPSKRSSPPVSGTKGGWA
ncbi:uncharacterized protein LOC142992953 [Genypterus blacodes]|uniref:uncharacterized protein LOC142992953 n=1 Tax=Genypterus blacodes TaxID=154954 RepID=UPI003F76E445